VTPRGIKRGMPGAADPLGSLAAAALSLGLAIGSAGAQPAGGGPDGMRCAGEARLMVRLELIFGTARPSGRPVSQAEWLEFLAAEVTPRFPAGLTVLKGLGQWQGGDGRILREQSRVLIIWHEPGDRTDADIELMRAAYKRRFDQESVMRVESLSCVSF
jgi:hypothetical protein